MTAVVLIAGPPAAEAGTYTVVSCSSAPGGVNNAWRFERGSNGLGTWTAMSTYACPAGVSETAKGMAIVMADGATRAARAASAAPRPARQGSTWGRWYLEAPAGAELRAIAASFMCRMPYPSPYYWGLQARPTGGMLGRTCNATSFTTQSATFPAGVTWLDYFLECQSTHEWCANQAPPRIALSRSEVTISDVTKPTITVTGGSLVAVGSRGGVTDVKFTASDNVGVQRAWLTVDGTARPGRTFTCDFTRVVPCPTPLSSRLELDTKALTNGQHTFTITIQDTAGNFATTAARSFTVNNSVYHAQQWTGNPAAGGGLVAEEWAIRGSTVARREGPDVITTRSTVPCAAADGGQWCDEVRWRTVDSQLGGAGPEDLDTFASHQGAVLDDPNVPLVGDITGPARYAAAGISPVATGPLGAVLAPWQVPPPGAGSTYAAYDLPRSIAYNSGSADPTSGEYPDGTQPGAANVRVWVDTATMLPVRHTLSRSGATSTVSTYFTYAPTLTQPRDHPADFFLVAPPAEAGLDQRVTYVGHSVLGTVAARDGTSFTPYDLGRAPTVAGQALCLVTTLVFEQSERTDGPGSVVERSGPDLSELSRVDALYAPRKAGRPCPTSPGAAGDAVLTVSSVARSSGLGQAYNETVQPVALAVGTLEPARPQFGGVAPVRIDHGANTAYVAARTGGGSFALANVDGTTVLAQGAFAVTAGTDLLTTLETR